MPSRLLFALCAIVALLVAGCSDPPGEEKKTQTPAPSAVETTGGGAPLLSQADFDLSEHQGKVVLLNFWATWCAPCRAEMPDLIQLQKDLGERGLQIVGVSLDMGGRKAVAPFVAERPINYPIVIDAEEQIAERYGGVQALPTTLVIGRRGKVQGRLVGLLNMEQIRPRLKELLAADSAPASTS